jgi:hypothetical protein
MLLRSERAPMKRALLLGIFASALLASWAVSPVAAGATEIVLPQESATFKPSPLPGYALVQQHCLQCHAAQYVQYQPPSSPRGYWEATVKKMKKPFGATFADEEIAPMVDYLAKTYGAEQSSGPPK